MRMNDVKRALAGKRMTLDHGCVLRVPLAPAGGVAGEMFWHAIGPGANPRVRAYYGMRRMQGPVSAMLECLRRALPA